MNPSPSDLLERARVELEHATPSEIREAAHLYDAHKRGLGLEPALDPVGEYSALPLITRYAWLATARHARGPAPSENPGELRRVFLGDDRDLEDVLADEAERSELEAREYPAEVRLDGHGRPL